MNVLAPLFLLGGLAVALPILFHLIRRTTRERRVFSSLMFLAPTPPRLTRRSRLEHILLLALRCLVLCLLALAFARPFLKKSVSDDPSSSAPRRVVLLVDTSASMRRANLWSDAQDKVREALRGTRPADQVALFAFDREARPLVTFEQWNATAHGDRAALVTGRLKDTSPGWAATHLGSALGTAAEALADSSAKSIPGPRRIVLISDLQEGAHLDHLQGYDWPKGIELSVEAVKPRQPGNAGLQLATDVEETNTTAGARLRVSNSADARREQFQVGWAQADGRGFTGALMEVYVPRGQSRVVTVPPPTTAAGVDRIMLQGDEEPFDNTVFVAPPEMARLSVLYLGSESEKDTRQPLYFLQRAFQETRRQAVQVLPRAATSPLLPAEAQAAALLVLTDSPTEETGRALRAEVAAGKTLLCTLRAGASPAALGRLLDLGGLVVEEARPKGYAMLAEIDFRHPVFAPFADPRFSDFTKIHFWRYRRVDAAAIPGSRVLAKFDDGNPALIEVPVGKGRMLVLTSGWQPDESQLALSTKFVPLLYSVLDYSGFTPPLPTQSCVGDLVPLASILGADKAAATVRDPNGKEWPLAPGATNFTQAGIPGVYTVGSGGVVKRFAVNLEPAESRTAPLPMDELERLGAPVALRAPTVAGPTGRKLELQNAELESRQKLWRWVIAGTLAVLLIETWLAGRTARRLPAAEEAVA